MNNPSKEIKSEPYLKRERVHSLLEKALSSYVITLIAGEGYGKSHAVYSFLRGRKENVVWITLSEHDNSPWRFWENITNTLGRYGSEDRKIPPESGFPEKAYQLNQYVSILEERLRQGGKFIAVIENFHLIHSHQILSRIENFFSYLIPNLTFILLSQRELEINTMPLLCKGRLSRIGQDELCFTAEECTAFFHGKGISINAAETEEILADTEGWAMALNFIAGEMAKRKNAYKREILNDGSIRSMAERYYRSLDPALRKFLVKLSFLDRWPREMLEKITKGAKAAEEIERAGSFIRYDAYLDSYHIHRIFLSYLREKHKEISNREIKEIYSLAAQWCAANNLRMDAAVNFEKAGDYKGLFETILAFPRILPRDTAAFFLEIITRLAKFKDGAENESLLALCSVIRPQLLMNLERFDEAEIILREAVAKFGEMPPGPLASHILSGCYSTLGTLSLFTARFTKEYTMKDFFAQSNYYSTQHPVSLHGPFTSANVMSFINQVAYPAREGEFEEFIHALSETVPFAVNCDSGYLYGMDDLARAEFAFYRVEMDSAEQFALQAVLKGRIKKQYEVENRGLYFLMRIHTFAGRRQGIEDIGKELDAQLGIRDYQNRYIRHDIIKSWFYAHTGQLDKIAAWIKADLEESDLNYAFYNYEIIIKAKYLYAENQYEKALKLLQAEHNKKTLGSFLLGILEMTVLEALCRFKLGDKAGAFKAVEWAYNASRPAKLDMPFIELGKDMRGLIFSIEKDKDSKTVKIPLAWLENIRTSSSVYAKKLVSLSPKYHAQTNSGAGKIPVLSRRESAVLNGLSQGFSRQELADECKCSMNVIKRIIIGLYAKLGAINRADAVRKAVKLGIVKK